ncbi:UDP-N-acetylglucosamine 1-carboxyvinyltransferase [Paraburkholderia sp. Clong3]|uniref:hypothetical protein n=1 Tax=Paraburkholderia sp. Clong3 TaxID=2991061 RepID=UPI003D1AAF41
MNAPLDLLITPAELRPIELTVGGYKHATVGLIALAIALARPVMLSNVPDIEDVMVLSQIIRDGGGIATWDNGVLQLDTRDFWPGEIPESLSKRAHGVLYLLPALLGRFGHVRLGESGGCALDGSGSGPQRPLHHMMSVLERFGARFRQHGHTIDGEADRLVACEIDCMAYSERADLLTGPLVSGATKTAMLAGACAHGGETRIRHYYPKPDVLELLAFLEQAGLGVRFEGKDIVIRPAASGAAGGQPLRHHVVSCVSEVMTYVALAQHCRLPLTLTGLTGARLRNGLAAELALLDVMGVRLDWSEDTLVIHPVERLHSCDIDVTSVGIYSDHQPFFALMLLRGDRPARIREFVWKARFSYASELCRLGARIVEEGRSVTILPSSLDVGGQTVAASDLRAAAVLVLAALTVPGGTFVRNVQHLGRGYPNLLAVLRGMGASIDELPSRTGSLVATTEAAP